MKEWRWLIVGTLVYIILTATVVGTIMLRGISVMQNIYVFNLGMELVGMTVGYLLFISCMADRTRSSINQKEFLLLLFSAFAGLYLDMVSWLVDGIPSMRFVNLFVCTLYYLCAPLQAYLFWQYLKTFIHFNQPLAVILDKAVRWGIWAAIGMRVLNLFTGVYFTVDELGVYHRADTYFISVFYMVFTLLASILVICQSRRQLRSNQFIIMISYIVVPVSATLVTAQIYGLAIGPVLMMGEVLLMYCVLNVERGREQALADQDLKMATRIQTNMLPNIFPPFPGRKDFDIYASMTPAKEVGGDFYDFFLIDEDHLGMVIADVSGKGVPAALFMMMSMILVKNTSHMEGVDISPGKVLSMVNDAICANNSEEMFVTVWLGIMTISTGKVVAANAGHEYPAIRSANGRFMLMKEPHGLCIGAFEGMPYRDYEFTIEKGGMLFVYTDGVPEATNAATEFFGIERMLKALNEVRDCPPEKVLENVKASVDRFVGDAPQFDDLTMMAVTRY